MSEEILKALMQLFAIISKQDEGVTESERKFIEIFLRQQLNEEAVHEYLSLYDGFLEKDQKRKQRKASRRGSGDSKLTSVKDSVRTLAIAKKINKTLTQKQKVVVLARMYELVRGDANIAGQRLEIIHTVASVFNVNQVESKLIEDFVLSKDVFSLEGESFLFIQKTPEQVPENAYFIPSDVGDGNIVVLRVDSVSLYFIKYTGTSEVYLGSLRLGNRGIYIFAHGNTIRTSKGKPVFYSDVVAEFLRSKDEVALSFQVEKVGFKFPNGAIGLRNVDIQEPQGKLVGIMGASGSGKTTLLNVLSGLETPYKGSVKINGYNIHDIEDKEQLKGVIGYIPQDDILIEELTVFENLYFAAKLCFKRKSEEELKNLVLKTLSSLGLGRIKDLKVGNPLDKTISGGQRKRLNIALELIREPLLLFVDEPTSGLSSRDSENVMELLRELAMKGKLIFVVIHQPSSDIYKMFDKMILMDTGGYQVYYGNPVEAVMYFKRIDNQINSKEGECSLCGNVNAEQIFDIIEAKEVDEYGQFQNRRKVSPKKWYDYFKKYNEIDTVEEIKEAPPQSLNIPNRLKQLSIFFTRDLLSKITDKQYLLINLLETPLLAFILAFIVKSSGKFNGDYILKSNDNIPAYIFMSVIVMLFVGMTVSAEEIIRDLKIRKRESFLNLSKNSYLLSKVSILLILSAIQSLLFILVGNYILEIQSVFFKYWLMLFSVGFFANMLGLNISNSFKSAVTIYIIIPILLIPQMILSGAIFSFDKLNPTISDRNKVPLLADFMTSRWAFEGLAYAQFRYNPFQKDFFEIEKLEANADYMKNYHLPEMIKIAKKYTSSPKKIDKEYIREKKTDLGILHHELEEFEYLAEEIPTFEHKNALDANSLRTEIAQELVVYLEEVKDFYTDRFNRINRLKEQKVNEMLADGFNFVELKDKHYNDQLSDVVKDRSNADRISRGEDRLYREVDQVFMVPSLNRSVLNYRTHFYAPQKPMFGKLFDTYYFNLSVIWFFSLVLYFLLYFDVLKKIIELPSYLQAYQKK